MEFNDELEQPMRDSSVEESQRKRYEFLGALLQFLRNQQTKKEGPAP